MNGRTRRQLLAATGSMVTGMVAGCIAGRSNGAEAEIHVAEGAAAVQEVIDDISGDPDSAKLRVTGGEGEWNQTVELPSNFTLEFAPGVTVTSGIDGDAANTFEVGDGTTANALIRNEDVENGNENITIRGGRIDFDGADTNEGVWAPVWLYDCDHCLFDDIHVENAAGRGGVMFTDCRNSIMRDCVARNIGYDGIALTLDCRRCDVYRCEAYECGGPGIQAATFGRGAGAPQEIKFIDCRTPEHIAVHGYEIAGGASAITIEGCAARRVSVIGEIRDFRIANCDVDTVALSALDETIRNGRIDGCTMGDRYGEETSQAATILWAWEGHIENVTFSNCTAQTDGNTETFVEGRLTTPDGTARSIDYISCAFDGDGAAAPVFIDHTEEGAEAYQESVGSLERIRCHSCKFWNLDQVVRGPIEGLRVRDSEFHDVAELHDGRVSDLKTRDNDEW